MRKKAGFPDGQLFGGPMDGLVFPMKECWLAIPECREPVLAAKMLLHYFDDKPKPMHRSMVMARSMDPGPPLHVYELSDAEKFHYEYKRTFTVPLVDWDDPTDKGRVVQFDDI